MEAGRHLFIVNAFAGRCRQTVEWARLAAAQRWQRWLALRQHWRPSEEAFHLALAAVVGILAGLVNFFFYLATESVRWMVVRNPGDPIEVAEMLPYAARFAVPALGALAAGLILQWGLRLARNEGSTNMLEVVVAGDGRLPLRTTLVKTASALLSIATGASIGREGSIVQLSATLASKGGAWAAWPPYRLRLLLACGAAAGMSAAYNAPIAGAVFAAQIVLGNFSMNLFAPLVCASVVAAVTSRSFFGIAPWYQVPGFDFTRLGQLPWFLVLGLAAGALGAAFLKLLQFGEALFQRTRWPVAVRLAVAGAAVGALALVRPEVWGNGYTVTTRILQDDYRYGAMLLLGLLAAKLLATVITVGAGTVGGVFTPTLFLGAALGGLFGQLLQAAGFAEGLPVGAFAVVGMGSMLAATTHSPLLAMIMMFEISLNYSVMPAVMLACAVATLVGRRLHPASVYTEPLRRKGLLPDADNESLGAAIQQSVGDLMQPPVPPLRETTRFREIAGRFLTSANNFLPVVNAHNRLVGVVALQDLKEHLSGGAELEGVIAFDVMRPPPPCLTPSQPLQDALPVLLKAEQQNIPVVSDPVEFRLVGRVVRAEALGALSEALAARSTASR